MLQLILLLLSSFCWSFATNFKFIILAVIFVIRTAWRSQSIGILVKAALRTATWNSRLNSSFGLLHIFRCWRPPTCISRILLSAFFSFALHSFLEPDGRSWGRPWFHLASSAALHTIPGLFFYFLHLTVVAVLETIFRFWCFIRLLLFNGHSARLFRFSSRVSALLLSIFYYRRWLCSCPIINNLRRGIPNLLLLLFSLGMLDNSFCIFSNGIFKLARGFDLCIRTTFSLNVFYFFICIGCLFVFRRCVIGTVIRWRICWILIAWLFVDIFCMGNRFIDFIKLISDLTFQLTESRQLSIKMEFFFNEVLEITRIALSNNFTCLFKLFALRGLYSCDRGGYPMWIDCSSLFGSMSYSFIIPLKHKDRVLYLERIHVVEPSLRYDLLFAKRTIILVTLLVGLQSRGTCHSCGRGRWNHLLELLSQSLALLHTCLLKLT